jgi:hypothetical protein
LFHQHNTTPTPHTTSSNMSQQTSSRSPPSYSIDSASDNSSSSSDIYVSPTITPTEASYIHHHQSLKYLVVLCEGLKDADDNALLDLQKEPFNKFKPMDIKPSLSMLKEEILRRYRLQEPTDKITVPRPRHWNKDQVLKWLHDNPIDGEADVLFLQREVEKHHQASRSARSTAAAEHISLSNWTGNVPHLRLIHCVVDDTIKDYYRRRDNLQPGRMAVENRNSSVREETVWEKISTLWINLEFELDTLIIPGLHPNEFQTTEFKAYMQQPPVL